MDRSGAVWASTFGTTAPTSSAQMTIVTTARAPGPRRLMQPLLRSNDQVLTDSNHSRSRFGALLLRGARDVAPVRRLREILK